MRKPIGLTAPYRADDDIQDYKKPWVGLTEEEIYQGFSRTDYAGPTAGAWRDGVEWAINKLKEKNGA